MEDPVMKDLGELRVVGFGDRFVSVMEPGATNFDVIPKLWDKLMARWSELEDASTGESYGVCLQVDPAEQARPGEFYYLAGAAVAPGSQVPDGMEARTVPTARYAVFEHRGPVGAIGETMGRIFGEWLPQSGYRHADAPELERYDNRFKGDSEDSVMEIWIPVTK